MKNKKTVATFATFAALAVGIGALAYFAGTKNGSSSESNNGTAVGNAGINGGNGAGNASGNGNAGNVGTSATVAEMALPITDKDKETSYNPAESTKIELTDNIGKINITEPGTYIVSGSTNNGMIIVNVGEEEDVQLVLQDVNLNSATSAAIYVISADETYITLEGENTLSNGGSYVAIDSNDIDAVIFSKDDLTINGSGVLNIDATVEHAIVCKDDMVITGGTYNLTAQEDCINTNDSLAITAGTFTLNCLDDAIHTDGILQIDGGAFDITAAEGLEGTYITINDGTFVISASDDGINAAQKVSDYTATLVINGGDITITMGPGDTDGIDSNGNIYINGGVTRITGQSTVDYDGEAVKNGGTLIINGEETDIIPNQFMGGGPGGGQGRGPGGFEGGPDGQFPGGDFGDGQFPDGMTPPDDWDGQFPDGMTPPEDWDGQFPDDMTPPDGQIPGGRDGQKGRPANETADNAQSV